MEGHEEEKKKARFIDAPSVATARRAMSLSRSYIFIAVFIAVLALTVWNYGAYSSLAKSANATASNSTVNSSATNATVANSISSMVGSNIKSGLALLSIPSDVLPALMLATPLVILFVYDKNTGVLEYLLSLGMTQRDIYTRYLKAAMLLVLVYLPMFFIVDLAYAHFVLEGKTISDLYIILPIVAAIALSTIAFMMTMMMAFSSLQKTRAGSNQPLAIIVGLVGILPGYFIPFAFPFHIAVIVEVIEATAIAAAAVASFFLSTRMISREKFLP